MVDEGLVYKGSEGTGAAQIFKFDPYKVMADQENKKIALAKAGKDKKDANKQELERFFNPNIDNAELTDAYAGYINPQLDKLQTEMLDLEEKGQLTGRDLTRYRIEVQKINAGVQAINAYSKVIAPLYAKINDSNIPEAIRNENLKTYNRLVRPSEDPEFKTKYGGDYLLYINQVTKDLPDKFITPDKILDTDHKGLRETISKISRESKANVTGSVQGKSEVTITENAKADEVNKAIEDYWTNNQNRYLSSGKKLKDTYGTLEGFKKSLPDMGGKQTFRYVGQNIVSVGGGVENVGGYRIGGATIADKSQAYSPEQTTEKLKADYYARQKSTGIKDADYVTEYKKSLPANEAADITDINDVFAHAGRKTSSVYSGGDWYGSTSLAQPILKKDEKLTPIANVDLVDGKTFKTISPNESFYADDVQIQKRKNKWGVEEYFAEFTPNVLEDKNKVEKFSARNGGKYLAKLTPALYKAMEVNVGSDVVATMKRAADENWLKAQAENQKLEDSWRSVTTTPSNTTTTTTVKKNKVWNSKTKTME